MGSLSCHSPVSTSWTKSKAFWMTIGSWQKRIVCSLSRVYVLFRWQHMWEVIWINLSFGMRHRELNAQVEVTFCTPSGFHWFHSCGHEWRLNVEHIMVTGGWFKCEVHTEAQSWCPLGFVDDIKVKSSAQSASRCIRKSCSRTVIQS